MSNSVITLIVCSPFILSTAMFWLGWKASEKAETKYWPGMTAFVVVTIGAIAALFVVVDVIYVYLTSLS